MTTPVFLPKAIFFRSIETLTETRDLQRRAFNAAFHALGLPWTWSVETYQELIAEGGEPSCVDRWATRQGHLLDASAVLRHKAMIMANLLMAVDLPLRAGVRETISEVAEEQIYLLLMCPTPAGELDAVLRATFPPLSRADFDVILSPEASSTGQASKTYNIALRRMGLTPADALVVTDCPADAAMAKVEGFRVVAFPDHFRRDQVFPDGVDVVSALSFSNLGSAPLRPQKPVKTRASEHA